jgi:serine/threonine protein kinase
MSDDALQASDPRSLDDYEIVGRLGEGASGVVYRAKQSDGAFVALKVLRAEFAHDEKVRERLRREATALQRVVGGRTAKVLKVEADGAVPYLVMELVPGTNLDQFVEKNGPLRGGLLWSATLGLVEALVSIHDAGVIHRDLKPSNILIGADGVKVVDFGISALHEVSSLTGTGTFIGTASWVSPEQVTGRAVTEASDVFSLGMVLAFASSGSHPFGTGRTDAVMFRITHEAPNLLGVPESIRPIVEGCLNKSPLLRPSLKVVQSLLHDSTFSGGSDESSDAGTKIVGQTIIEADFKNSTPVAKPLFNAPSVKSAFKQNQMAGIAALVVFAAIATFFVTTSNGDSSSIYDADVVNTDVAITIPDPIDVFSSNLDTFTIKSSIAMNDELGIGLTAWSPQPGEPRHQIWGTQLDCYDYYPLYDLGFADSSVTLKSGTMINSGDFINGAYMVDYRFFTDFNNDPMNFTRRAAVVESKFSGCDDRDYYPSTDVAISPCLGTVFKDDLIAFPNLDESCAKDALRTWKYSSDSRNQKTGFYPDSPMNGRTGSQYIFAAKPKESDQCCASVQWASAMVWEKENIGLVLTVAGYSVTGKKVEFDTKDDNTLTFLTYILDVANKMVIDAFGS